MKRKIVLILILVFVFTLAGCGIGAASQAKAVAEEFGAFSEAYYTFYEEDDEMTAVYGYGYDNIDELEEIVESLSERYDGYIAEAEEFIAEYEAFEGEITNSTYNENLETMNQERDIIIMDKYLTEFLGKYLVWAYEIDQMANNGESSAAMATYTGDFEDEFNEYKEILYAMDFEEDHSGYEDYQDVIVLVDGVEEDIEWVYENYIG